MSRYTAVLNDLVSRWQKWLAPLAQPEKPAQAWAVEQQAKDEALFDAVGGYLTEDGKLKSFAILRGLLREWLCPARKTQEANRAYDIALVELGLDITPARHRQWYSASVQTRKNAVGMAVRNAQGWENDCPASVMPLEPTYLQDFRPDGSASTLLEAGVRQITESDHKFLDSKVQSIQQDLRRSLTYLEEWGIESKVIQESLQIIDKQDDITYQLVRIAMIRAVAQSFRLHWKILEKMAQKRVRETCNQLLSEIVEEWDDPELLVRFVNFCNGDRLNSRKIIMTAYEAGASPVEEIRTLFDGFTSIANVDRPHITHTGKTQARKHHRSRLSVALELAIADVVDNSSDEEGSPSQGQPGECVWQKEFGKSRIAFQITRTLDYLKFVLLGRENTLDELKFLKSLRKKPRSDAGGTPSASRYAKLLEIIDAYPQESLSAQDSAPLSMNKIVEIYYQAEYLIKDKPKSLEIFKENIEYFPLLARSLNPVNDNSWLKDGDGITLSDVRSTLAKAMVKVEEQVRSSGDGGILHPTATSFATLVWWLSSEEKPDVMRELLSRSHKALGDISSIGTRLKVAGALTKQERTQAVVYNKKSNFNLALREAHNAVWEGIKRVKEILTWGFNRSRETIAEAVSGLADAELQLAGVYVRAAETAVFSGDFQKSIFQNGEFKGQIIDISSAAYHRSMMSRGILDCIDEIDRLHVVSGARSLVQDTAWGSCHAMGMRTFLLLATLRIAYQKDPGEMKNLLCGIPQQFSEMLERPELTARNFHDLTRIALHNYFLTGKLNHPAKEGITVHPDTPGHLRPAEFLDIYSCSEYLVDSGVDAGVLDIVKDPRICRLFDEKTNGGYSKWRGSYNNPKKRSGDAYNLGEVTAEMRRWGEPGLPGEPLGGW